MRYEESNLNNGDGWSDLQKNFLICRIVGKALEYIGLLGGVYSVTQTDSDPKNLVFSGLGILAGVMITETIKYQENDLISRRLSVLRHIGNRLETFLVDGKKVEPSDQKSNTGQ